MTTRTPRFPKKRTDGSFCIEVTLRVTSAEPDELAARIQPWLEEWVKSNRYWKTDLARSVGSFLDFFDDFADVPSCLASAPNLVSVRLEARPAARKWWKDWLVLRLLKDLLAAFTEIVEVERILNCP